MQWPAMVNFPNSDELEIIPDQNQWDTFSRTLSVDCELICSDGAVYNVVASVGENNCNLTGEKISVDAAVELARKHMAAQAHCCVSKFYAPSVENVIAALSLLEDQ